MLKRESRNRWKAWKIRFEISTRHRYTTRLIEHVVARAERTKKPSGRSLRGRSAQAQVQVRGYKEEKLELAARTLCFICPSIASCARSLFVHGDQPARFVFFFSSTRSRIGQVAASLRCLCHRRSIALSSLSPSCVHSFVSSRLLRDFHFDDPARLIQVGAENTFIKAFKGRSFDAFAWKSRKPATIRISRYLRLYTDQWFCGSQRAQQWHNGQNRFILVSHDRRREWRWRNRGSGGIIVGKRFLERF